MGEIIVLGDSLLMFYDEVGEMFVNFEIGFSDIIVIVYSLKGELEDC